LTASRRQATTRTEPDVSLQSRRLRNSGLLVIGKDAVLVLSGGGPCGGARDDTRWRFHDRHVAMEAVMTIRTANSLPPGPESPAGRGAPRCEPAHATTSVLETQPVPAADGRDLAALRWDLTVHELYRVFAAYLGALLDPPAGRSTPVGAESRSAGIRLAATRQALRDIEAALLRVEAGSYGICDSCNRTIARQRLRAAPTTVRCSACHAAGVTRP
jgi:hypothetical protein